MSGGKCPGGTCPVFFCPVTITHVIVHLIATIHETTLLNTISEYSKGTHT